jgi:hypothetical protein
LHPSIESKQKQGIHSNQEKPLFPDETLSCMVHYILCVFVSQAATILKEMRDAAADDA